jgi:hypothetical protein
MPQTNATEQHLIQLQRRTYIGVLIAAGILGTVGQPTNATILMAGDDDNFQAGDPVDTPFQRPPFDQAVMWEHNNHVLHGGFGRNFDQGGSNHTFGYSFGGLPIGQIAMSQPVLLEVEFRTNGGDIDSTDHIRFQLIDEDMPGSFPGELWVPPMSLVLSLPIYVDTYGDGSPPATGVLTTVDLRTIVSDRGPYVGQTIAETINNLGHLDVFIDDDTGIDYMRLTYTAVPEPGCLPLLFIAGCWLAGRHCANSFLSTPV